MSAVYSLADVSFAYPGRDDVISGLSTEFHDGQVVAVVGDNGSGKSTLLDLLSFLRRPRAGQIRFMGGSPSSGDGLAARRRIGCLPQNPYLFLTGTVFDNVSLGLRFRGVRKAERSGRVMEWLERLGLADLADVPVGRLSGGRRQLLALARVLVLRPRVLLLDEPFTYLDNTAADLCANVLRNMSDYGISLSVVTTHDREGARGLENHVFPMSEAKGRGASVLDGPLR